MHGVGFRVGRSRARSRLPAWTLQRVRIEIGPQGSGRQKHRPGKRERAREGGREGGREGEGEGEGRKGGRGGGSEGTRPFSGTFKQARL
jgi:hypothetical protein